MMGLLSSTIPSVDPPHEADCPGYNYKLHQMIGLQSSTISSADPTHKVDCFGYDIKPHLMMALLSWRFAECKVISSLLSGPL